MTAIDSAPTAIALARRNATEAGVTVEFRVAHASDPLGLPAQDLVVDNHLLHGVVIDAERAALLDADRGAGDLILVTAVPGSAGA